jgi:hypothetical protein
VADCNVKNCPKSATEIVETTVEGGPLMQAAACATHALEIRAGARFMYGENHELLMGEDLPLDLVTYKVRNDGHGVTIELSLGRGPEVRQKVSFRAEPGFRFGRPGDLFAGPSGTTK